MHLFHRRDGLNALADQPDPLVERSKVIGIALQKTMAHGAADPSDRPGADGDKPKLARSLQWGRRHHGQCQSCHAPGHCPQGKLTAVGFSIRNEPVLPHRRGSVFRNRFSSRPAYQPSMALLALEPNRIVCWECSDLGRDRAQVPAFIELPQPQLAVPQGQQEPGTNPPQEAAGHVGAIAHWGFAKTGLQGSAPGHCRSKRCGGTRLRLG